jgi:hypothetical protein
MPYLPNEIWLAILTHCDHNSAWQTLRPASSQLKSCVEEHFFDHVCHNMILHYAMALPEEYEDPAITGRMTFKVCGSALKANNGKHSDRLYCHMYDVEPAYCERAFLSAWAQMRSGSNDQPAQRQKFNVWLDSQSLGTRRLADARIGGNGCGIHGDDSQLSFDWKTTITGFFLDDED